MMAARLRHALYAAALILTVAGCVLITLGGARAAEPEPGCRQIGPWLAAFEGGGRVFHDVVPTPFSADFDHLVFVEQGAVIYSIAVREGCLLGAVAIARARIPDTAL